MNRQRLALILGATATAVIVAVSAFLAVGVRPFAAIAPKATIGVTVGPPRPTAVLPGGTVIGVPPTPDPNGSALGMGQPAIVASPRASGTPTAAFSGQDAINYVNAHPDRAQLVASGYTIVGSEFLTADEVATKYGIHTYPNIPPSRLLCVVQTSVNFQHGGVAGGPVVQINKVYVVFDALTGNLIMSSGSP